MIKTKEQQSQEYAEKKFPELLEVISTNPWNDVKTFLAQAHKDGYTACEQSMWRSVEEERPEDDETVLTYSSYGHVLAYYSEQDKMWFAYGNYGDINPTHWMPIPSIPDTNTEKQ